MKRISTLCLGLFTALFASAQPGPLEQISIGNTLVTIDTVYTGLDIPWEISAYNGQIWVTERKGIVSRLNPVDHSRTVLLDLTDEVTQSGEGGLLGMALHPHFDSVPRVFLVYTYGPSNDMLEKLVRFDYANNMLTNEVVLIDSIAAFSSHNGSRLLFLPDSTLLMSTGDAQQQATPQDLNSLNGKILRVNTDGSVPADNPFPGSLVYSYGHRNVQGMVMLPNGRVYISEHGPSNDDEFQELLPGRNYGWPNVEGFCNTPSEMTFCADHEIQEPVEVWTPTIAPADLAYYSNPAFPEFDGRILMAVLKDKKVIAMQLNSSGDAVQSGQDYLIGVSRLRDICVGPNQEIYIATNGQNANNDQPNTHSIIVLYPPTSLGVAEITNPDIQIYPNPVLNNLNVDFTKSPDYPVTLKFVSTAGQIIQQQELNLQATTVDVSKLTQGWYVVTMEKKGELIFRTRIYRN
jgi:glucose/arabinose dehydrogenase